MRQYDHERSLELFLTYRIPCLMIQFLNNPYVSRFMTELITNNPAIYTIKEHDMVVNHLVKR